MTKENITQERLENYTNKLIAHMEEMTTNWQHNAAYLKSWIKNMKEEPKFLVSVLADVSKAVNMFNEQLNKVATAVAVAA